MPEEPDKTAAEARAERAAIAQGERARAVDEALDAESIREAIRRSGLSAQTVRTQALTRLDREWRDSGAVEERVISAREAAAPPRRGLLLGAVPRVATVLVALSAVTVAVGLVQNLGDVANALGGTTETRPSTIALLLALPVALTAIVFAWARLRAARLEEWRARQEILSPSRRRYLGDLALRQVRKTLNDLKETEFSRTLDPLETTGLSDLFDPEYDVSTHAHDSLSSTLKRLRAGSIGLAGPRGAGKTTLLRAAVDGRLPWDREPGPLGVTAPAPVRYDAREFVPHLFAQLCLRVLGPGEDAERLRRARAQLAQASTVLSMGGLLVTAGAAVVLGLVPYQTVIAAAAAVTVVAVAWATLARFRAGLPDASLKGRARQHLDRLRYLETRSQEWSAEFSAKPAKVGSKTGVSLAAQPWTMPELTADYGDFVGRIAEKRPVVIGIDELDKMASVEEAQRFLNEIKSLFGQPDTYYLVSLSDDAMSAFERRGLPLRDVFESVFDDVLRVEPLTLAESAKVMRGRTVGVAPPFVALCHVLSGGLPRELIRVAREAVRVAEVPDDADLSEVTRRLVVGRTHARQLAAEVVARRHVARDGTQPVLRWLRGLESEPDAAELLARSAVAPAVLDVRATAGEPDAELELLLVELGAASYHAASVLEFFSAVDAEGYESACSASDEDVSLVELLASATRDLGIAPELAWAATSRFRERAGLAPHDYPLGVDAVAATPE